MGKRCKVCNVLKKLDDFYKNSRCIGGKDNRCKECERKRLGYKKTIKRSKVEKEIINGKEVISKLCTKCDVMKQLDDFNEQPDGLFGKESHCRTCRGDYREQNKDELSLKSKEYYNSNQDLIKKKSMMWYRSNHDKAIRTRKNYYESNKDKISELNRIYRMKNRERILKRNRRFYQENKETYRENVKLWRKKNKHLKRISENRRRARKLSLPDDLNASDYNELMLTFNNSCALSGEKIFHLDHVIPLNTGRGGTTLKNIIPLSPSLNSSKQDKNIFIWFNDVCEERKLCRNKFNKLISYLAEKNSMSIKEYEYYVEYCHENPLELEVSESG